MRVLVAPDSFKGTISATRAAEIICGEIQKVFPHCITDAAPIGDGGEGTIDALIGAVKGKKVQTKVTAPLGNTVQASYGIFEDQAILEMAEASGIMLVAEKDPLRATSYGTGELIKDAVQRGIKKNKHRDWRIGNQ